MNSRKEGQYGEELACEYLKSKGYKIEEMNFRCHVGEIDIIAMDKQVLVFVEVKRRRQKGYGRPCESVTPAKIRKIERTALYYQMLKKCFDKQMRIDVIEIYNENNTDGINHLINVTG